MNEQQQPSNTIRKLVVELRQVKSEEGSSTILIDGSIVDWNE